MPPRDIETAYRNLPDAHTLTPGQGLVISAISGRAVSQKQRKQAHVDQPPAPSEWRVEIAIFPRDVRVKQRGRYQPPPAVAKAKAKVKRQKIVCLSSKSRRALTFEAGNIEGLTHMLTLTYPADFPTDGRVVKKHLEKLRHWLTRRGIGGLWVLEFQARGAPHFHVWTNGDVDKRELSQIWYAIVGSGDERHLRAGTNVVKLKKAHALSSYAAKYGAKMMQKGVPEGYEDVGRFWGTFGGIKAEAREVITGTLHDLAPIVRVARKAETANRRKANLKPRKYSGKAGRTFFNSAKYLTERVLDRLLPEPHFYRRTGKTPMPTSADTADTAALVEAHFCIEEQQVNVKPRVRVCVSYRVEPRWSLVDSRQDYQNIGKHRI
jgi:hypothetical protein